MFNSEILFILPFHQRVMVSLQTHPSRQMVKVLSLLRQDSRMKLVTISKKTGIEESLVFSLLKEARKEFIAKNTALLDFEKLGYDGHALIFVKGNAKLVDRLKKYLYCHSAVNLLFKIHNGYDFVAEVICESNRAVHLMLEELKEKIFVQEVKMFCISDEIVREGFVFGRSA
jgi:DNA-binding Lrp family transcriptional regulator